MRNSLQLEFNQFLQHLWLLEHSLVSLVVFSMHEDSHKVCLFSFGTTFVLDMMIDWAFILVWPAFVIKKCYIWLPVECSRHLCSIEIVASMVTAQSSMGSSSGRSRLVVPTHPRLIIEPDWVPNFLVSWEKNLHEDCVTRHHQNVWFIVVNINQQLSMLHHIITGIHSQPSYMATFWPENDPSLKKEKEKGRQSMI